MRAALALLGPLPPARLCAADTAYDSDGLRRFLMLVAACVLSHNRGQPEWLRTYEQNLWAATYARDELRIHIPRWYAATDRARVRELIRRTPNNQRLPSMSTAARWAEKE